VGWGRVGSDAAADDAWNSVEAGGGWSLLQRGFTAQCNEIAANALILDAGHGAVPNAHIAMIPGAAHDAVNAIDGRCQP
jgi:hypothetical protein